MFSFMLFRIFKMMNYVNLNIEDSLELQKLFRLDPKFLLIKYFRWRFSWISSKIYRIELYSVHFNSGCYDYLKKLEFSNSNILIVMKILRVLRIHPARTSEPNVPDLNIFQTFDQRLMRLVDSVIFVTLNFETFVLKSLKIPNFKVGDSFW